MAELGEQRFWTSSIRYLRSVLTHTFHADGQPPHLGTAAGQEFFQLQAGWSAQAHSCTPIRPWAAGGGGEGHGRGGGSLPLWDQTFTFTTQFPVCKTAAAHQGGTEAGGPALKLTVCDVDTEGRVCSVLGTVLTPGPPPSSSLHPSPLQALGLLPPVLAMSIPFHLLLIPFALPGACPATDHSTYSLG